MRTISQIVDTEAVYRVAVQQLKEERRDIWSPAARSERVRDWLWKYAPDQQIARPSATQPPAQGR